MDSNPRFPVRTSREKARWILSQRRIAKPRTTTAPLVEEGGFSRLGAEDRDVAEIGRPGEQFLDRAQARHAVADNNQLLPTWAPAHTRASARLLGRCCARKLLRM